MKLCSSSCFRPCTPPTIGIVYHLRSGRPTMLAPCNLYQPRITAAAVLSNPRSRLPCSTTNGSNTFNHDPWRQRIINALTTTVVGNNWVVSGAHTNIAACSARHGVPQHVGRGDVTRVTTRVAVTPNSGACTVAQGTTMVLAEYTVMTAVATTIATTLRQRSRGRSDQRWPPWCRCQLERPRGA